MDGRIRGRSAERARLGRAIRASAESRATTVLLHGEPGIGKTVLLDELAAQCAATGFRVWRAKADHLDVERPYATLRAAFGAELVPSGDVLGARADLGADDWVTRPELGFRIVDRLIASVDAAAAGASCAVIVDDLHWADEPTLRAISMLVRHLRDRPLLVGVAARPSPRSAMIERLADDLGNVERIEVSGLDASAVHEVVGDILGARADASALELASRANGNPFFLHALVTARDRVDDDASGDESDGIAPPPVRRVVLDVMHELEPASRDAVRLASAIGDEFSVTLLADLTGRAVFELAGSVEAALQVGLLVDEDGRLRFRHDLVREIVYDSLPPAMRAAFHLQIGRRLHELGHAPTDVASHFVRGAELGDVDAARVLRSAAADISRMDPRTATEMLKKATALLPEDHADRLTCAVELAQLAVFSAELATSLERAEELLARSLPPDLELSLRNSRSQVFFLSGDARQASTEFESMAPLVAGQPREALLLADAAVAAMFAINVPRAGELARRSIALAARHDDSVAPALANGVLSWLACFDADFDLGVDLAARAVESADAAPGLEGHRRIPHLFQAQALLWADRTAAADVALRRGRALSRRLDMGWDEPMYQALVADALIRAGEWDDALAEIEAGIARAREVDSHFADGWLHVHRARILLWRDRVSGATAALDDAAPCIAVGPQGADQFWQLHALMADATGDGDRAATIYSTLWEKLGEHQLHLRRLELAPDVVRFAIRRDVGELAVAVLADVELLHRRRPNAMTTTSVRWCRALSAGDAHAAELAVECLEGRDHPIELARCRADLAAMLARSGAKSAARSVVEAALATFDGVGAAFLRRLHFGDLDAALPRSSVKGGVDALTKSERAIVHLVGEGLSNSEIADRLSISRRTVESHLYHAYPKLGVNGRVELALFAQRELVD